MDIDLKHRVLRLLKEDEEFRYAVAGLIGLEEVLKRFSEHDRKFNEVMLELRDLKKDLVELRQDLVALRRGLGGLSATVGALSEGDARRALREWLRERGLRAGRLRPIVIIVDGEELEIDLHGSARDEEGREVVLYAEAKSAVRAREVREFARIVREAEKKYGEGLKIIIAYRIYEDAYRAADEEGIQIIEA